jgi:hypothetical protein
MSPVSPPRTLPGVWLNVSQTDRPRPSSATAPSIWYAAVAAPQVKPSGNRNGPVSVSLPPDGIFVMLPP